MSFLHSAISWLALCVGLGGLLVSPPAAWAEDAPPHCGIPGFVTLPCDPRFQPQRSSFPDGTQQILFHDPQSRALYRALPYITVAKEADPLKSLITGLRTAFTKQFGQKPQEAWGKSKQGVDFFYMDFGQGRFVTVGAVQEGYLLGAFQFSNLKAPLVVYLQANEVTSSPPKPIDTAKYPPKYPIITHPPNSVPADPNAASWRCHARGFYETCRKSTGTSWERGCLPRTSEAMGFGATKEQASVQAQILCSGHMTRMVIIGNIGGVGQIKTPCQAYSCVKLR